MIEPTPQAVRVFSYDECRIPATSEVRRWSPSEWQRLGRLLDAWGVSNKPAKRKRRLSLQKGKGTHRAGIRHEATKLRPAITVSGGREVNKRFHTATDLRVVFGKLSALKKVEDVADEFTFRPSERAFIKTKLTIMNLSARMGQRFPKPRIVADGEGGVIAAWRKNGKQVRLRIQATDEDDDYIYYQSKDDYDVEKASIQNLRKRLEWLNST